MYSWWDFEDTNWVSSIGFDPISYNGVVSTNAGAGHSMLIDSTNAAWLQYNTVEDGGYTNLTVNRGTILFWFAPMWSSTNAGGIGPGEWSRLIEVGAYTTNASVGWWSLYTDPAGSRIYFSAQTNGATVDYLSAPIAWTNNTWHHVALTYSETNTTLYLEGNVATNGAALTCWPGPQATTNGFFIGSASSGWAQAHGMFDSMATYDSPLNAGSIGSIAGIYSIFYDTAIIAEALSPATNTYFGTPRLSAIWGDGFLQWLGNTSDCITSSNVWLTNTVGTLFQTSQTMKLNFAIQGGTAGYYYDVFGNAVLGPASSTNFLWVWMGQGTNCSSYAINDLPIGSSFLILGTPLDSDFDGLTDAYEKLVSHSDPSVADSGSDGISDLYKLMHGLQPTNSVGIPTLTTISIPFCPIP